MRNLPFRVLFLQTESTRSNKANYHSIEVRKSLGRRLLRGSLNISTDNPYMVLLNLTLRHIMQIFG